ncbi:hypothetical protein MAPG_01448 [Magnaporthiopsis poae ATCC 64411]|uniref:Uncharacterized protein n=1 Tax=Magnaporthiopsis poae (strain ATCC 64411 / 73-15) TaxID=644358 RepID=A0A0C4DNQ4_MAGP6|nr:hypothetical protein MAPG_01448 [Magnaporthiopsis poae ATCC 64411]
MSATVTYPPIMAGGNFHNQSTPLAIRTLQPPSKIPRPQQNKGAPVAKKQVKLPKIRPLGSRTNSAGVPCPSAECTGGMQEEIHVGSEQTLYLTCTARCGFLARLYWVSGVGYRETRCRNWMEEAQHGKEEAERNREPLPSPFCWGRPTFDVHFDPIDWNPPQPTEPWWSGVVGAGAGGWNGRSEPPSPRTRPVPVQNPFSNREFESW